MAGVRPYLRKRRTRQHVIADLSANHVERHVLACGFSVERVRTDYGFDLLLFLYDSQGRIKAGRVVIQLKATDHLERRDHGSTATCVIDARDLNHWMATPEPVILVLYDGAADIAYWAYVQAEFTAGQLGTAASTQVRVRTAQVLDAAAVRRGA